MYLVYYNKNLSYRRETARQICDPDPPTLQTDAMRSQYRALHYSASHGKNHHRRPIGAWQVAPPVKYATISK